MLLMSLLYSLNFFTLQDYVIDSNWRFRSTVMTPMFVETQSSQGPESLAASQSGAMKGKLRATQTSLEFSQTQTGGTTVIQYPDIKAVLKMEACAVPVALQSENFPGIFTLDFFCFSPGRRTAYNWLTGSSVDTLAEYTLGSETLSSLMVFDKKAERQTAARRPVGEGFGLRRLTASTDEVDSRTRG